LAHGYRIIGVTSKQRNMTSIHNLRASSPPAV